MNIETEILKEHSKQQSMKIASWIGGNKDRFAELMELFLNGDYRITQRSVWIISLCVEQYPSLATPWLRKMIKKTQEADVHDAVKRNAVRLLQFVDIPRSLQGTVANLCFAFLQSADTPIAVKAFSMTVLANIAKQEPDLKYELKAVIDLMLPYSGAGIQSRGKKVLSQLAKNK
ncbi:MAG: hypothetical protein PHP42_11055 [Bacteroidota bacterium]|nr:hypothetical protein [Bacteroidota bacterium]